MRRIKVYSIFERFWHWAQAILFILLAITGFQMRFGYLPVISMEAALHLHELFSWIFIVLFVFAVFWHITTGEWKQYKLGSKEALTKIWIYYTKEIFKGAPHPFRKTQLSKLNPLQRVVYFVFNGVLFPLLMISGLLYMGFQYFPEMRNFLPWISNIHVLFGYILAAFVILHVYLTTTGHTLTSNIKSMITGWEETDEDSST